MRPTLRTFPYGATAGALTLGAVGGWLFSVLHVPLPWMLGSIVFCLLAALLRLPIAAPAVIRPPVSAILGALIGVSFTPEVLMSVPQWILPLLGMLVFTAIAGLLTVIYFQRVAGFDLTTAYFCGMPGGLAEMVLMGDQMGADSRKVALIHAARIMMVVLTVPFIARHLNGAGFERATSSAVSILQTPPESLLWFAATCVVGVILGVLLRLPAGYLLGPMLASLVVHVMGWNNFVPPFEIVFAAQVIMGATIGCRFVGTPVREIFRVLGYSVGSFLILMATAVGLALGVAAISGHGFLELLLAYAPGGLAEMSLVALALNLEVAFVATHHILRVLLVNVGAAIVAQLIGLNRAKTIPSA